MAAGTLTAAGRSHYHMVGELAAVFVCIARTPVWQQNTTTVTPVVMLSQLFELLVPSGTDALMPGASMEEHARSPHAVQQQAT